MSNVKQTVAVAALLGASALGGFMAYNANAPKPAPLAVADEVQVDAKVHESLELKAPDGTLVNLSAWKGKPQIVNFWATWCGPCRDEMPVLVKAQQDYADQDLVVIGLSMDYPEDTDLVTQFVTEYGVDFPILMAVEHGNALAESYGAENFVLPISVFIKADGTVTNIHTGLLTEEQADAQLKQLF